MLLCAYGLSLDLECASGQDLQLGKIDLQSPMGFKTYKEPMG